MERAEILKTDFSTADADYPTFALNQGQLRLDFIDWQERSVRIQFDDVCAVRWQEVAPTSPLRDDVTYEIHDSEWLAEYKAQIQLGSPESVRHYKLCFNAIGTLDVLASGFKMPT